MTTITLSRQQLHAIASLAHCASTDDITPIITAIKLTGISGGNITAIATDRYKIAELSFVVEEVTQDFEILINAKKLLAASKSIKGKASQFNQFMNITISGEVGNRTMKLDNHETSVTIPELVGNYPPVARLLDSAYDDIQNRHAPINKISLSPKHIADIAKVMPPEFTRAVELNNSAFIFNLSMVEDFDRVAPTLITRKDAPSFRALLQPNLILN